jgi:hypothetical protein|tara:strand:- start:65 stop:412 length:348 start_codon:yes stop_codon:yes gene_type:complete
MAITTTWSVNDMTHMDSDGGVILVYWSLTANSDGTPLYTAQEGGKLKLTYDASSSSFISYDDLKESDVLGWVYDSLIEGEETADEAKKRIEDDRTAKVQGQIDRAASQATGLPWE